MILSIKKLENSIKNRNITPKQFILYSFFVLGSAFYLVQTSRDPVHFDAFNISLISTYIRLFINIVQFRCIYKIVKGKNINLFLYAIIPTHFVICLRYGIFMVLPLVLLNYILVNNLNIDSNFWNVINLSIITIVVQIIIASKIVTFIKRIYENEFNEQENK